MMELRLRPGWRAGCRGSRARPRPRAPLTLGVRLFWPMFFRAGMTTGRLGCDVGLVHRRIPCPCAADAGGAAGHRVRNSAAHAVVAGAGTRVAALVCLR